MCFAICLTVGTKYMETLNNENVDSFTELVKVLEEPDVGLGALVKKINDDQSLIGICILLNHYQSKLKQNLINMKLCICFYLYLGL